MTLASLPLLTDGPRARIDGTWIRSGSCDQCAHGPIPGECCTKLALPVSPTAASNPDTVHFFALHGVEIKWWGDLPLAIIPERCSALLPNGDCSLYGSPERPDVCSAGPLNAWTGSLNPACSYVFERDGEQE